MAHHGSTPAAWTAVVTSLVGFTVGGVAMVIGPNWPAFWAGCALVLLGPLLGKVLSSAGQGGPGGDRQRHVGS
jgi:peptidoglycan/LPS O-acetylase OafA/YrhL